MKLPPDTPLAEVRAWVEAHAPKGVTCPACDQHAKVYHRALNSGHGRCLLLMLRHSVQGREWLHVGSIVRELGTTGGDFAVLVHFGLIEPRPNAKGWWKLTARGAEFARGHSRAPRHADIYNGELRGLDATETVDIRQVLGHRFDLDSLLQGIPAHGAGLVPPDTGKEAPFTS